MTTNDTYMYIVYNPLTHIDKLPSKGSTEKFGIWTNQGGGQTWNLSDVLHKQDSQLPETSTRQFWQTIENGKSLQIALQERV